MSRQKENWRRNSNQTKWCSPWISRAKKYMVKVTKRALKTMLKERIFTDDTLYTIMTEVNSTVNSQPLTNVSDNIDN